MRVFSQMMKQIVLIGLVELTILYLVKGQDKFPGSLEVSPSSPSPGVTLNMTCSFKLLKSEFGDVRVREDKILIFFSNDDWRTKWPKVKDYGQILSETEETMSKAWLTFQPSFCDNKEMEKKYEFHVDDNQLGFSTAKASVTFTVPGRKVFLNDEEICQDGTHTQSSEAVGKEQTFKLVAEHELEEIKALKLEVANKTFSTFTPNNDAAVCVYGGEVSGNATFPNPGEFTLEYTIQKDSGGPVPKTCKIEIEAPTTEPPTTEEPTTVATTTTELKIKDRAKSVTVTTVSPPQVTTEQGIFTSNQTAGDDKNGPPTTTGAAYEGAAAIATKSTGQVQTIAAREQTELSTKNAVAKISTTEEAGLHVSGTEAQDQDPREVTSTTSSTKVNYVLTGVSSNSKTPTPQASSEMSTTLINVRTEEWTEKTTVISQVPSRPSKEIANTISDKLTKESMNEMPNKKPTVSTQVANEKTTISSQRPSQASKETANKISDKVTMKSTKDMTDTQYKTQTVSTQKSSVVSKEIPYKISSKSSSESTEETSEILNGKPTVLTQVSGDKPTVSKHVSKESLLRTTVTSASTKGSNEALKTESGISLTVVRTKVEKLLTSVSINFVTATPRGLTNYADGRTPTDKATDKTPRVVQMKAVTGEPVNMPGRVVTQGPCKTNQDQNCGVCNFHFSSSGLSVGEVVGILIGSILAIALIFGVVLFTTVRRLKHRSIFAHKNMYGLDRDYFRNPDSL